MCNSGDTINSHNVVLLLTELQHNVFVNSWCLVGWPVIWEANELSGDDSFVKIPCVH